MTQDSHLPYYLREGTFRQYEKAIADIIHAWPQLSYVDPTHYALPKSILTCESRLRYAFKSLYDQDWETSLVDKKKFRLLWHDHGCPVVAVRQRGDKGMLLVGLKKDVRSAQLPEEREHVKATPKPEQEAIDFTRYDAAYIIPVVILASKRALNRPIRFQLTNDEAATLESLHDIAFDPQPDGTFLLL